MKPIIKTESENEVALKFVERLMEGDPEKDSKEGQLLNLLTDEIQVFEKRYDEPAKAIAQARSQAFQELEKEIERMKIEEKGNITVTFADGHTHLIEADTNRALLYNSVLSSIIEIIRKKK